MAKTLLELSDLDKAPLKVVVCEARQLCSGATGRNGGHIKSTPYEVFSVFRSKFGPQRARELTRFQMRHLPTLLEVGAAVPVGEVRVVRTVDLFIEQKDLEKARCEVEELREWVPEAECQVWDAEGAREEVRVYEVRFQRDADCSSLASTSPSPGRYRTRLGLSGHIDLLLGCGTTCFSGFQA